MAASRPHHHRRRRPSPWLAGGGWGVPRRWARLGTLAAALIGALIAALVSALAGVPGPSPAVAAPASPEAVVRAWVAAVNRADAEAAIALYADDAVIEALGQQFRGKGVIAQRQRTIVAAVLRPSVQIERLTAEGEAVTVQLVGENAITRFDGRGPVRATTTFYVRDGLIQREVGPVLDPPDAAWYADALPRFRATGALPTLLPRAGEAGAALGPTAGLAALLGAVLLASGLLLLRRRYPARCLVPARAAGASSSQRRRAGTNPSHGGTAAPHG